jgi:hypothetical protein
MDNMIDEHVSENKKSYWLSDCYLDTGGHVMKDTPEGRKITAYIKEEDAKGLSKYLTKIVIKALSLTALKRKIEEYGDGRYKEGIKDNQQAIQQQLGLRR